MQLSTFKEKDIIQYCLYDNRISNNVCFLKSDKQFKEKAYNYYRDNKDYIEEFYCITENKNGIEYYEIIIKSKV